VGPVHRLVKRVVLRIADKLAAIGESLEEEAIHPLINEQDLYLGERPTGPEIRPICGLRLGPRSRGE
jgi:hypothetical protein